MYQELVVWLEYELDKLLHLWQDQRGVQLVKQQPELVEQPGHDCRCNWGVSSKAMEADVCTELVKACEECHKAQVAILMGDDDSSTIKKVRESVNHNVEKWSDIVHAKRAFGSSMYNL